MTHKEAIEWLVSIKKSISGGDEEFDNRRKKSIDMAIKAIEDSRWIPVTERLPEENGRYLVTRGLKACGALWNRVYIANYSDLMGIKSERIWWQGNVGKSDFESLDDVIAWMPLPKRYEEGAEE